MIIHPLDYARTLAAADDLPDELVGRLRTLSSTPAWLRFGAAAPACADSRGQGRGRGGRGRGRRQGRGPPGIDQLQGMPTLPELPSRATDAQDEASARQGCRSALDSYKPEAA